MILSLQVLLTLIPFGFTQSKNVYITGVSVLPAICFPTLIASSPIYTMNFNFFLITTVATMTVYCVEEVIKQKINTPPRVLVTTVAGYSVAFLTTLL